MYKILFLNPPFYTEETYGKFSRVGSTMPFLGLCYLAAILKRHQFDVKIVDTILLHLTMEDVLKEIQAYSPDVVGITVSTLSSIRANILAQKIKKSFPNITLIAGGPHISECTRAFFIQSSFDVGVIGEGEWTILELARALRDKEPLGTVNGLLYKDQGEVVSTKPRAMEKDLDQFPFPVRELLPPLKNYRPSALYYKRTPVTQMMTSRGCPAQCIFCDTPFGKTVRYHSPEYVIDEMILLKERFGIKEVLINDDTFVVNKQRIYEICRLMRKKNLGLTWSCNVRVNMVDYDILKEMKASGCWLIMPGVESGSQEILNLLRKGITLEQVVQVHGWAHKLGLLTKPSFIIGNPGDTLKSIDQTIRFAKSLRSYYPSFTLFTPFPGTPAYDMASTYGTVSQDSSRFALSTEEPSFVPFGLTEALLKKKQKEGFQSLYFDFSMAWRHLRTINSMEDISKITKAAGMLLMGYK
ncbi:MAG: radical SAM protein [Candidatus Omnitrophica bacterium]|nr:radical SAM protein [Candidatus Omnitrophota bacterium]